MKILVFSLLLRRHYIFPFSFDNKFDKNLFFFFQALKKYYHKANATKHSTKDHIGKEKKRKEKKTLNSFS